VKKQDIQLPRTYTIPVELAHSTEIDNDYKFLYCYIEYRCSTRGYVWYQNDTLAEHIGKSLASIKRGLKALADAEWIKIENRVKKGRLYEQDHRRVIWIYSDYLRAKEVGHGYSKLRPLPFNKFKTRFINAMSDETKSNQILFFFPMLEFLGDMKVNIDPSDRTAYRYKYNNGKWETSNLTKEQTKEVFEKLYDFYVNQHQQIKQPQEPQARPVIQDFKKFQAHIRREYIDKVIFENENNKYSVNVLGYLTIEENGNFNQLSSDAAIEVWQYLFTNQNKIKEIE